MSARSDKPVLQVGGPVSSQWNVYIVRPSDHEVFDLLERGEYCNVLCSRQTGKTSLLYRTKERLAERGMRTASVDVAGYLGSADGADVWYRGLLQRIARELRPDLRDVTAWWKNCPLATPNQRLIEFFRTEVNAQHDAPVVIFLDEIDGTLKLPFTDDLFVAIRAMYNERPEEPAFRHITFCLLGVATPNELIKDRRTTPYNVGRTIELNDFDPEHDDLSILRKAISGDPHTGALLLREVLRWTGGHPYLTIKLCDELVKAGATTTEDVNVLINNLYLKFDIVRMDVHFDTILRLFDPKIGAWTTR